MDRIRSVSRVADVMRHADWHSGTRRCSQMPVFVDRSRGRVHAPRSGMTRFRHALAALVRLLPPLLVLWPLACSSTSDRYRPPGWGCPGEMVYEQAVADGGIQSDGGAWTTANGGPGPACIAVCGSWVSSCSAVHACTSGGGDCVACSVVAMCD
jgi:hypothetical protein